jgi:hypothetical protein
MIAPLGFFRIVPLHSPYLCAGLLAVTTMAVVMLVVDASAGRQVLVPVLVLQMFAASTGFAVPARRGHYDLLLTGGSGRLRVSATHLLVSIVPGMAAWLSIAGAELAVTGNSVALASGSIAALLLVSTLAWALTVPLPRLSGGMIWLLANVILLTTRTDMQDVARKIDTNASLTHGALMYALCPFLLIGRQVTAANAPVLVPAVTLSLVATTAAVVWMSHMEIKLEASQ